VQSFADTGFPVDFVYPKEGAVTLLASVCPVAKQTVSPHAHEFVRMMVAPELQLVLAKEYGYGPVNKKTAVPPADVKMAPIGERASKLLVVDWDVINQNREEWTKRWNREVER
jgi:putative spermidine/putrescine transport system substrate-binding protein